MNRAGGADERRHSPRTRLPVTPCPVIRANRQAVCALRVAAEQAANLASNRYSLAEPACLPRAIVAGRTVAENAFNIPRFMIDAGCGGAMATAVPVSSACWTKSMPNTLARPY